MATKKKPAPRRRRADRRPYANSPTITVLLTCSELLGTSSSSETARALRLSLDDYLGIAVGRRQAGVEVLIRLAREMGARGFYIGERACVAAALLELRSAKRTVHLVPDQAAQWCELAIEELRGLELHKLLSAIATARRAGLVR